VVVPDGIPYDEVRQLEAHLRRALAAYDYQESDKDHYPLTICRVWREREWRASPEQMQAEEKQVEKLAIQGATLQEALEQFHPALQVKKDLKKRAAMRRAAMLSLLDYSAKKEQMLQDYCAQLEPQIETGEPWDDAQTWTILTGEVEVLIRDTLQLYHDLVRADEFHHYCAATQAQYPYVQSDAQLEALFHKLRELLEKEIALAAQCAHHGYAPKGQADLVECIRAVEVLLADESPIYTSEPFQAALQQSLDDVKAGRVVEMTPEQL